MISSIVISFAGSEATHVPSRMTVDVIRNSEDLCHFMGDVDDTTSLISQHIYNF